MVNPKDLFDFRREPGTPQGKSAVLEWTAPKDLPYFDGHFPQNPILPAIAVVDGTLEALRLLTENGSLALAKIKSAKFLSPITPGVTLQVGCARIRENDWEVQWASPDGLQIFAQLKLLTAIISPSSSQAR